MFRITNLMPVYEQDGTILEYRISDDIDITAIADVCRQKLRKKWGIERI